MELQGLGRYWGVGGRRCGSCRGSPAAVHCRTCDGGSGDGAYLCAGCGEGHARAGHERVWVCEVCELAPAASPRPPSQPPSLRPLALPLRPFPPSSLTPSTVPPQVGCSAMPLSPEGLFPAVGLHSLGEEVRLHLRAALEDDSAMMVDSHE